MNRKSIVCAGIISLLFVGCASQSINNIKREVVISDIDFRKYSEHGFLFTPFEYSGKYESVGIVSATIFPAARYYNMTSSDNGAGSPIGGSWTVQRVFANDVIDSLYSKYSALGANAIVDLKLSSAAKQYNAGMMNAIELQGVTVTGFAIKRSEQLSKNPPMESPSN